MLARRLEGVAVLVSSSRYLAGRLAEHHFGCTVHVLDDGFQHFDLHRDADILVIARADLARPVTLPAGRLREPIDAAAAADAIVMLDDGTLDDRRSMRRSRRDRGGPSRLARAAAAGDRAARRCRRHSAGAVGRPRRGGRRDCASGGILRGSARRGLDDRARAAVSGPSPLHGRGSRADRRGGARRGRRAVVTTEKDLVRLLPFRPFAVPVAYVPMTAGAGAAGGA